MRKASNKNFNSHMGYWVEKPYSRVLSPEELSDLLDHIRNDGIGWVTTFARIHSTIDMSWIHDLELPIGEELLEYARRLEIEVVEAINRVKSSMR